MILYFTGTGNSKYIAKALSSKLNDELVSLNDVIKFDKDKVFNSALPFVIVAPIYAWRYPRIIEDLLREVKFNGNSNIYFLATMGGNSGKCDEYCKTISKDIGMSYLGFRGVLMPDNYIAMYSVPSDDEINKICVDAKKDIDEIANAILNLQPIEKTDKTPCAGFMSRNVNNLFYKYYVNDKGYYANDDCNSCSLCEKVCPINNIEIKNGKPAFNNKCISCMSCIHHCPKKALNIKGKTENKKRYICKEY